MSVDGGILVTVPELGSGVTVLVSGGDISGVWSGIVAPVIDLFTYTRGPATNVTIQNESDGSEIHSIIDSNILLEKPGLKALNNSGIQVSAVGSGASITLLLRRGKDDLTRFAR